MCAYGMGKDNLLHTDCKANTTQWAKVVQMRHPKRKLAFVAFALVAMSIPLMLLAPPTSAEVRFGKNVRIGGHDVSGQTFNSQRRGEFYIYNGKPKTPGCTWRANRDGSRTNVCHLQRKPTQ